MSLFPIVAPMEDSGVAEVSLTANAIDATSATVYTFSTQALGVAAADRIIVVGAFSTNVARTISTITVGGVSATLTVAQSNGGGEQSELWQAAVPTGTTGDIVVTWSGGVVGMGIGVWRIVSAASAAHDTGGDANSNPATDTLDIPASGVAIGFVGAASTGGTVTWTGLTERYDALGVEAAGSGTHSGSSDAFDTLQTGLAISATLSNKIRNPPMAIASWGPA